MKMFKFITNYNVNYYRESIGKIIKESTKKIENECNEKIILSILPLLKDISVGQMIALGLWDETIKLVKLIQKCGHEGYTLESTNKLFDEFINTLENNCSEDIIKNIILPKLNRTPISIIINKKIWYKLNKILKLLEDCYDKQTLSK